MRPDWDDYFLSIAKVVATRSNCVRRQTGAVIVTQEHQIITTGYNGTPRGYRNCDEGGCPRCSGDAPSGSDLSECFCSHAEENAIVQAALHGVSVKDGHMYATHSPCLICAKMIVNAGIRLVVFETLYPTFEAQSKPLLKACGVTLVYKRDGKDS